jgi:hypothetical protein
VYELIRTTGLKVDALAVTVSRLEATVGGLVTQEQRAADNQLASQRVQHLEQKQDAAAAHSAGTRRLLWTTLAAPLLVALLLYVVLPGGKEVGGA